LNCAAAWPAKAPHPAKNPKMHLHDLRIGTPTPLIKV
jgi:hypothetical protein